MSELEKRKKEYISKIENIKTQSELGNVKSEIFGKNGYLTLEFKKLASLSSDQKKNLASSLNDIKKNLTDLLNKKAQHLNNQEINPAQFRNPALFIVSISKIAIKPIIAKRPFTLSAY